MRRLLAILVVPAALWAAGGDTLRYSTGVRTFTDGDTLWVNTHYHPLKDSIQRVINGKLGNINLASDANILPSKLDSSKTLYMRKIDIDSVRGKPNVDTIAGPTRVTTGRLSLELALVADSLQGKCNTDTLTGPTRVTAGRLTLDRALSTDSIVSNPAIDSAKVGYLDPDTLAGPTRVVGGRLTSNYAIVADTLHGKCIMDTIDGAPIMDSIRCGLAGGGGLVITEASGAGGYVEVVGASQQELRVTTSTHTASAMLLLRSPTSTTQLTQNADTVSGTILGMHLDSLFTVTTGSNASGMAIYTGNQRPIAVGTNNTERLKINGSGDSLKISNITTLYAAGAAAETASIKIGGGSTIDSIAVIDGGSDTLVISVGAKNWKFLPVGSL